MVLTNLKQIRETKGLSRETVAAGADLSVRTVENAEAGKGVTLSSAKRIAKALKTTVEELRGVAQGGKRGE